MITNRTTARNAHSTTSTAFSRPSAFTHGTTGEATVLALIRPLSRRSLRPDLLRVGSHRKRFRISRNELHDGGLECRTLAVSVACDRPTQPVKLAGIHGIPQRFLADVEV